ncbi:hypothetical protein GCM10010442_04700 [Kitasatospora kifunensis]
MRLTGASFMSCRSVGSKLRASAKSNGQFRALESVDIRTSGTGPPGCAGFIGTGKRTAHRYPIGRPYTPQDVRDRR